MRNLILFTVLLFSGFVSAQSLDFSCAPVCLEPGDGGYQEYAWSDLVGGQSSQLLTNPWYPGVSVKMFPQQDPLGWLVTEITTPYSATFQEDLVLDFQDPTGDLSFMLNIVSIIEGAALFEGVILPLSPNCEGEEVPVPGAEEVEEEEVVLEDNSVCVEEVDGGYNLYVSSNYNWYRVPECNGLSSQLIDFRKETSVFLADTGKGQCLEDGLLIEFGNASAPYYQLDVKASFSVTTSNTCIQ